MLERRFPGDAHFACYSMPAIERRLDVSAVRDPAEASKFPDGVPMVLAAFDVDCDLSHRSSGAQTAVPAPDEWWLAELPKIAGLREVHPGAFVYRTKGGYRIVATLSEPIVLRTALDDAAWTSTYVRWVAYLRRSFGIFADPSCSEWVRLFRAPHATREGSAVPEERETIGDAAAVGPWYCEPTPEDIELAATLKRKKPTPAKRVRKEPSPTTCTDEGGVLFHAFAARGELGQQVSPGKWAVICPWIDRHSRGAPLDSSTVLFGPRIEEGEELGWLHCSHGSYCQTMTIVDVLRHFTPEEIAVARVAAGLPSEPTPERPSVPQSVPDDDRPEIVLSTQGHELVDQAIAALRADPNLYTRAGSLVHVIAAEPPLPGMRDPVAAGTPLVREVGEPTCWERVTRHARWLSATKDGELKPASPPARVISALLARGQWDGLRPLVGVTESPILRADGSVHASPGYDPMTGYILSGSASGFAVADRPTREDARRALVDLLEPFAEVPFASHAARYVPVAAALTMLLRPLLQAPVPAFAFDAPAKGSGKSLVADCSSILGHGRAASPATWPGENLEELEKQLGAYAIRGAAVINFDNVDRGDAIGGAPLDKVLTAASHVDLRVLGRSQQLTLRWQSVILFSGNNLALASDTTRRIVVGRIEPQCELPAQRAGFTIPDLRAWCQRERGRLVAAMLTLASAYIRDGRRDVGVRSVGSFEEWARLVPAMIVWAGGPDVTACIPEGDDERDVTGSAERGVLAGLADFAEAVGKQGVTARDLIGALYPSGRSPSGGPPDGFDELRGSIEALVPARRGLAPDTVSLGKALAGLRGKWLGGMRIESLGNTGGGLRWAVRRLGTQPPGSGVTEVNGVFSTQSNLVN
jgi:putative DNA primase/helicase